MSEEIRCTNEFCKFKDHCGRYSTDKPENVFVPTELSCVMYTPKQTT